MSIKKKEIEFRSTAQKDGSTLFESRVIIRTQRTISAVEKTMTPDVAGAVNEVKLQMEAALMNHIYGDLVLPINELAILAQHHLTGMNDAEELLELKSTIDSLVKGD